MPNYVLFLVHVVHMYVNCAIMAMLSIEHNGGVCVIICIARDIPAFVMYCFYGASGSFQLIESIDSMITINYILCIFIREF